MSTDADDYEAALAALQLAMVRWQVAAMARGDKTLLIFEGRDAAGKDGAIKRLVEHASVRATRIVALSKPSDREKSQWFFQRYVAHLPSAGELVIFNRSWYNRAGVERVMDFSTAAEQEDFICEVPQFEAMLVKAGIKLVKLWLDVSKSEQAQRLKERATDPLKVLKTSPLDEFAQSRWDAYSLARNEMLTRTDTDYAPWFCVRADKKKEARLNILRHLVHTLGGEDLTDGVQAPDPKQLFRFEPEATIDGRLAR